VKFFQLAGSCRKKNFTNGSKAVRIAVFAADE
jgi:hypothetical protein